MRAIAGGDSWAWERGVVCARLRGGRMAVEFAVAVVGACAVMGVLAGAASAGSKLYWSNYGAGTVSVANLDGSGSVSTYASELEGPNGIAFDAAGNLYVANDNADTVTKVTPAGASSMFATGVSTPYPLAIDAAGNLYVGGFFGSIYKITSSGLVSTFATGTKRRAGLAFDAAGNLYASNPTGETISKITPAGTETTFASGLKQVEGLAFDAAGNLYAAIENGGKITRITPAGASSTFVSGLDGPEGLAIDAAGNLYVGQRPEAVIEKITPAGVVSPLLSSVPGPEYLAIAEAPSGAGAPVLAGAGTVGSSLSCGAAAWAPDPPGGQLFRQPLSSTIAWQLSGSAIAGASGSSFTPTQPGSYTCTSTATNQAGSSTQRSAALQVNAVPATPSSTSTSTSMSMSTPASSAAALAPTVTQVFQAHAVWAEGSALASFAKSAKKKPVGTTFSFTLNESANVSFAFTQKTTGRKIKGKCAAKTKKNSRKPACTRAVIAGTLSFTGHSATNKVVFQGRLSHAKKLKPGRYTLIITATNSAGKDSAPTSLSFTIVN